jgi:glycosyltransferase involved in cell wall biosynthesis
MRVALAHDYLIQAGGAERVVAALHRIFPEAPVFTTIADPDLTDSMLPGASIRTSWMQRLPGLKKHFRKYVLLYPTAIESLDFSGYDLVISSSSAFAKGIITPPGTVHICYCHTPMRFGWSAGAYAEREEWGPLVRTLLPTVTERLRRWDLRTANRPTLYVANSTVVAQRISDHYGRTARVVFPPVELDRVRPTGEQGDFHLVVSRLVPYKRIDLAVETFTRMGRPLVVIGDGPARGALEKIAGPTVRFMGRLSDAEVARHYASCRAVIFPGEEDFGIVPLEANAAGRPVIAFQAGGALDTVVEGQTGIFFKTQTVEALTRAVLDCQSRIWRAGALRRHAEAFREEVFRARMLDVVHAVTGQGARSPSVEQLPATA